MSILRSNRHLADATTGVRQLWPVATGRYKASTCPATLKSSPKRSCWNRPASARTGSAPSATAPTPPTSIPVTPAAPRGTATPATRRSSATGLRPSPRAGDNAPLEAAAPAPPPAAPAASAPSPRRSAALPATAIGGGLIAVCACLLLAFFFFRQTETVSGEVEALRWERSVEVEIFATVQDEGWEPTGRCPAALGLGGDPRIRARHRRLRNRQRRSGRTGAGRLRAATSVDSGTSATASSRT